MKNNEKIIQVYKKQLAALEENLNKNKNIMVRYKESISENEDLYKKFEKSKLQNKELLEKLENDKVVILSLENKSIELETQKK